LGCSPSSPFWNESSICGAGEQATFFLPLCWPALPGRWRSSFCAIAPHPNNRLPPTASHLCPRHLLYHQHCPASGNGVQQHTLPLSGCSCSLGGLSLFASRMVTVHQIAHFVDRGFSRQTAARVFGNSGLITGVSFVFFRRLSDIVGRERAFMLGTLFQALAFAILLIITPATPSWLLTLYAILWGIGEGSRSGLLTAIASDTFPGPAVGAIVGSQGAMFALGAALGSCWRALFLTYPTRTWCPSHSPLRQRFWQPRPSG